MCLTTSNLRVSTNFDYLGSALSSRYRKPMVTSKNFSLDLSIQPHFGRVVKGSPFTLVSDTSFRSFLSVGADVRETPRPAIFSIPDVVCLSELTFE